MNPTNEFFAAHPEAAKQFDLAIQLKSDGKTARAIAIMTRLTRDFPRQSALWWFLGSLHYHSLGNADLALPKFRKAVRLAPESPKASLGLFHSLWSMNKTLAALRELHRFQSVSHLDDYDEIWAEVQVKMPNLSKKSLRRTAKSE